MSFRKRDTSVEHELGKFLNDHFYNQIATKVIRHADKTDQLSGKDVTCIFKGLGEIIIDEKAATHYINKDIKTFAFELSFKRTNGEEVEGWLLDPEKMTQYYLLMWLKANNEWHITSQDITEVKALLINRKDILNYLKEESYGADKLRRANDKIRANNLSGPIGKTTNSNFYFFRTIKLTENPVNIIIKRKKLAELAIGRYVITPDDLKIY